MMFNLYVLILLNFCGLKLVLCSSQLTILMPNITFEYRDRYFCQKHKLDSNKPLFITEFETISSKYIAHHIMLYGCEKTNQEEDVWLCDDDSRKDEKFKSGITCEKGKIVVLYAWSMDAEKLVLPEDVGFRVGGDSEINYLVLQVHYAQDPINFLSDNLTHKTGVMLTVQDEPVKYYASVFLLFSEGYLRASTKENIDIACEFNQNTTIYPFAYSTHTHKLGIVNSGYVIRKDSTGNETWTEIGRRSSHLPQMFMPVTNKVEIRNGDVIAARCTMNNINNHTVKLGPKVDNEMCNFYFIYYEKENKQLNHMTCESTGPPFWGFKDFKYRNGNLLDLAKIPKDIDQISADQIKEPKKIEI